MSETKNLIYQNFNLSKDIRNKKNNHNSFVMWFTGLSGSGKSTIANELQNQLFQQNINVFVLDGDNTRMGINSDLDFSDIGRKENIRRVAEISKLMIDAGIVVIASFISPFNNDRLIAKNIVGAENFIEIFVDCPLEVCENRDVKGLYLKARNNEINNFTGISSPFEIPINPNIIVHSDIDSIQSCVDKIIFTINDKLKINEV